MDTITHSCFDIVHFILYLPFIAVSSFILFLLSHSFGRHA